MAYAIYIANHQNNYDMVTGIEYRAGRRLVTVGKESPVCDPALLASSTG